MNTMCLVALCGDKKSRVHPTTLLLITLSFSGNVRSRLPPVNNKQSRKPKRIKIYRAKPAKV